MPDSAEEQETIAGVRLTAFRTAKH